MNTVSTASDPPNPSSADPQPPVSQAWARPGEEVLEALGVSPQQGLASDEVRRRRQRHGSNQLTETRHTPLRTLLLNQFKSVVVVILGVAAVLALLLGELPETLAIGAVLLVNGGIGFVSEWRAVRSMESLRRMGQPTARVRRSGRERQVATDRLVVGDVVLLEAGDVVPADLRLIEANNLGVDESALSGESVAATKQTDPVDADAPLAERRSMLFRGTTLTEGSAEAVVVAVGMQTELGRIVEMTEEVQEELTPLEQRLEHLGRRMAWLVLGVAAAIAVAGVWAGQPTLLIVETAIALGVAAVPEGLPIVANIALTRGMWLMSRRQALINRLPAVETLGATRVILTDKTGTLTENRMTLHKVVTAGGDNELDPDATGDDPRVRRAVELGALCNNAALADEDSGGDQGDPTEVALLRGAAALGIDRDALLADRPETREVAFDPEVMMMATFHRVGDGFDVAVKGAPQAVLDACRSVAGDDEHDEPTMDDQQREHWHRRAEELAGEGLRVLAVADRRTDADDVEPYEDLRLVGLVALHDPPRESVRQRIAACHEAGIGVVMVTGDQAPTARAIARALGITDRDDAPVVLGTDVGDPDELSEQARRELLETPIFARVSPAQKLKLVELFQRAGYVVAMTGDGVNDAPALKKADIGVAMGRRGTDAAREASDMVLKDDSFSSIVAAVQQGRVIFSNIRKSVVFMLCTNIAEIIAVGLASLAGAPLPLLPLQILYLNVVTDVFPALALGVGKGSAAVMNRPPRRAGEPVLTRGHWAAIGGWGLVIAACVLAGLALALTYLDLDRPAAVTVSFLTLGMAKLWFVLNLRDRGSRLWDNDVVRNPWLWGAIGLCVVLLAATVYLPGLSSVLKTRSPGPAGYAVAGLLSLAPCLAGQALRYRQRRRPTASPQST